MGSNLGRSAGSDPERGTTRRPCHDGGARRTIGMPSSSSEDPVERVRSLGRSLEPAAEVRSAREDSRSSSRELLDDLEPLDSLVQRELSVELSRSSARDSCSSSD
jgi:hypothetical protein